MTTLDHLTTAILTAEAQAHADHEAGTCQESEWSCSWCPGGDLCEAGADA